MLPGIIGSEIAEAIWPVVKVVGIIAVVGLVLRMIFTRIQRLGASQATAEMQGEAERGRIEFEKDRVQERESAMDRWRRRRAERAARLRGEGSGPDGDVDS